MSWPTKSEARLEPYYVVRGLSFGQIKPRILFALDTSGSMTTRARPSGGICAFGSCEAGSGENQSRIHAARLAINTIVEEVGDGANFGFMTFDQETPPSSNGSIPSTCSGNARFRSTSRAYLPFVIFGWLFFEESVHPTGTVWELCGKNRPYAYLRWDDLGVGVSVTNGQATLPPTPMLTGSGRSNSNNANRKVQWFQDFLGPRVNLDPNDPDDYEMIKSSRGDYGGPQGQNASNTQLAQVANQDFYYWPYVDGFPGYSYWYSTNSVDEDYALGHVIEDNSLNQASLYGPFYLESALVSGNFAQADIGPASLEEARNKVLAMTSDFELGGVDASGSTPWEAAVGPVTAAPPASNGPFSHPTIASYLKFAKNVSPADACVPTATIIVTDGAPDCVATGNGSCSNLHKRLDALRTELDSLVYVVGFFESGAQLNKMACAGAGGCPNNGTCPNPCSGTPFKNWDTCYDPNDHNASCAWVANSAEELAEALGSIVDGLLALDVDSGPGASVLDVGVGNNGQTGGGDLISTSVNAYTQWPDWRGHVARTLCTDIDPGTGNIADYCVDTGVFDFTEPTFGPCPQARSWDAGSCLEQTPPMDRRIYINDASNGIHRIIDPASGNATPQFLAQLNSPDLGIVGAPFSQAEADAIAQFVQGVGWRDDWKLPGLANSAPVVIRRIPPRDDSFSPSVGIRDPHCAGRILPPNTEVDKSLQDFAEETWDPTFYVASPAPHHEYQEAVIIGDDLGLIHAFQYNSGNELFAFLPRFVLQSAVDSYAHGGEAMGQPQDLDDHVYGVAATPNHTWVYDPNTSEWRHLAIIGAGKGAPHYAVLDLSHMSPNSSDGPFEVLWTTADPGLKATYEPLLGETWSRPALIFHVPNEAVEDLPEAKFVLSSGYASSTPTGPNQGRAVLVSDALTGTNQEWSVLPAPTATQYESNFGAVIDPAVGSHCISRYWSEAQETYFLDPAGRFYRWDLGRGKNHEADWGGPWGTSGGTASPIATFRACQGTGQSCTISSSGKAEPFTLPAAVVALNRIDELDESLRPDLNSADQQDRFLIAFASGNLFDDAVDGGDINNDFHSSIYLVADDHQGNKAGGISIPNGGGRTAPGSDAGFLRLVLSDLQRTRTFTPFPGSPTYTDTAYFSKAARPIAAPTIRVTRAIDVNLLPANNPNPSDEEIRAAYIPGIEVYYIEYRIYEPSSQACDPRFFDSATGEWALDPGSTYTLTLRLTANDVDGFDFINGSGTAVTGGGFTGSGLELGTVTQVNDGNCGNGLCGPARGTPRVTPCDPNVDPTTTDGVSARGMGYSELRGFSPFEQ